MFETMNNDIFVFQKRKPSVDISYFLFLYILLMLLLFIGTIFHYKVFKTANGRICSAGWCCVSKGEYFLGAAFFFLFK